MAKTTLKFKDSVADFERIMGDIAARRFAGIYLLMGEESYFIDRIADRLAASILDEAARAFNQITVYGRDSDAGQIVNLCRQMPMMGQYEVVIVKEAQQLKGIDRLSLYTQKPSPTTILVICHKEKSVDSDRPSTRGVPPTAWCSIGPPARLRDRLVAPAVHPTPRPGDRPEGPLDAHRPPRNRHLEDRQRTAETHRLAPEGTKRITDRDIEANIGISKDFNNFELCKAVVTRDMNRALMIADHFARNPKENPLLLTVMALFNQFRDLFVVNYLRWLTRHRNKPFPSDQELMRHPAQEQHLHSGRNQAERLPVGQSQGLPDSGAAARIRRQKQGTRIGRCVGRRAAARTAAENLPPVTDLYLYQTIHLARGTGPATSPNMRRRSMPFRANGSGVRTPPPPRRFNGGSNAAPEEHYPTEVSGFIRLELLADGSERLLPAGISYYDGYGYRSVQPAAVALRYDLPLTEAPTSVHEAATLLARRRPNARGRRQPSAAMPRGTSVRPRGPRSSPSQVARYSKRRDRRVSSAQSPGRPSAGPGWSCARRSSGSGICPASRSSYLRTIAASPPSRAATECR